MAYLDKREYERREMAALNRMRRNEELCDTLTADQHDTLAWLCSIRHQVHSSGTDSLYNEYSGEYKEYWKLIDTENDNNAIVERLKRAELPKWEWTCDRMRFGSASEATIDPDTDEEIEDDDARDKAMAEHEEYWCNRLSDLIERWNDSIEAYLKKIDEEHGTNYCPTGKLRRF